MANKQLLISSGDGTAVPAGYVGETVTGTVTNSVSLTTSYASITGTSISLSPGIWMIYAQVSLFLNIPPNSGSNFTQLTGSVQLATSTGTNLTERSMYLQSSAQTAFGMVIANYVPINHVVNITSTTTYQLNGKYTVAGTNPGVSVTTNTTAPFTSVFYAVRIA